MSQLKEQLPKLNDTHYVIHTLYIAGYEGIKVLDAEIKTVNYTGTRPFK
jgi:hypothetical protein